MERRTTYSSFQRFSPRSTVEKPGDDRGESAVRGGLFIYVLKLEYIRECPYDTEHALV